MQRTCRTRSCLRSRSICHVAIGVFLLVSSAVPFFVSISLSVPRARMHRHLPPLARWMFCSAVRFLRSCSLRHPSPSIDVGSVGSVSFLLRSVVMTRSIRQPFDRNRRMEGVWSGFQRHQCHRTCFRSCVFLSFFLSYDGMVFLLVSSIHGIPQGVSLGWRRDVPEQPETTRGERQGCLFDGSIGPSTRWISPRRWSRGVHHPMKRRNDETMCIQT